MTGDARERAREAQRRYRERNRDLLREKDRARIRTPRTVDPEKAREKQRRYREKDPERSREKTRRWRAANPEKARAATRQSVSRWREANPGRVREARQQHIGKLKAAVLDHYGRTCACCGSSDRPTVDHINGDGDVHREQVGGGWAIYRWLISNGFPEGFQTLCRRCNASKAGGPRCRINHGETA